MRGSKTGVRFGLPQLRSTKCSLEAHLKHSSDMKDGMLSSLPPRKHLSSPPSPTIARTPVEESTTDVPTRSFRRPRLASSQAAYKEKRTNVRGIWR